MGKNGRKAAKERKESKKLQKDQLKKLLEKNETKEVKKEASQTVNSGENPAQRQESFNFPLDAQAGLARKEEEMKKEQKIPANSDTKKKEIRKVYEKHNDIVYRIKLDCLPPLPPEVRKILEIILEEDKEESIIIKGGIARLVLLENMIERTKIKNQRERMQSERRVNDMDIIVLHRETLLKSAELLKQIVNRIRSKLLSSGIYLDPEDIEPIKINGGMDKTINRIVYSRDMTINQVVMKYENENWILYYTPQCYRHLKSAIGMLGAEGKGTLRLDVGRKVPTPYGLFRMLKFWVEGKILSLRFPAWMLEVYKEELKRTKGIFPMGAYGAMIAEKYSSDPEKQRNLLIALKTLGLTNLENFDQFSKQQHELFQEKTGKVFKFQTRSFEDILENIMDKRQKKVENIIERKNEREGCAHEFDKFVCGGCKMHCNFQKCKNCTAHHQIQTEIELPCNVAIKAGNENFLYNGAGYFNFPR